MKRISLVAHLADLTGSQMVLADVAQAVIGSGVDTEVICPAEGPFTERLSQFGIPWRVIQSPLSAYSEQEGIVNKISVAQRRLRYVRQLRQHLIEFQPDLVVVNSMMNFYGGIAARSAGLSTVFFVHEIPPVTLLNRFKAGVVERCAHAIIAPSIANASWFRPETQQLKFHYVPLAVDLERFAMSADRRNRARQNLSLDAEHFAVGMICHITPNKRVEDFLKAAQIASRESPQCRFFVVGSPDVHATAYYQEMQEFVETNDLQGVVTFLPHTNAIEDILAAFDLLALCSRSESSPRVLLEAMAASVPVIATSVGGVPDLLGNGKFGVLVPPQNPNQLARGILDMMRDRKIKERYATLALEVVRRQHNRKLFNASVLKVLNEVGS